MSGIGHNKGPSLDKGAGFRRVAWKHARQALLPSLPLEVIRTRVARANALGLPYRTYASIRAGTGEDIYAFLFSSNALGLLRQNDRMTVEHAEKLARIQAERHATLARRLTVQNLAPVHFNSTRPAPPFGTSWTHLKQDMRSWLATHRLAPDRVVMVGATSFEREHATAGRLAAFLPAATIFPETPC